MPGHSLLSKSCSPMYTMEFHLIHHRQHWSCCKINYTTIKLQRVNVQIIKYFFQAGFEESSQIFTWTMKSWLDEKRRQKVVDVMPGETVKMAWLWNLFNAQGFERRSDEHSVSQIPLPLPRLLYHHHHKYRYHCHDCCTTTNTITIVLTTTAVPPPSPLPLPRLLYHHQHHYHCQDQGDN